MSGLNLEMVWVGLFCGMLTGCVQGLFFHKENWAGGYDSWSRRLMRLGHVSFFGLAFVNLVFVVTVDRIPPAATYPALLFASWLLAAGAVLMPTVCFLAAWRKNFRYAFPLPVGCLLLGVLCVLFHKGVVL